MRANFNDTLKSWTRRADPKARLILEAGAIAGAGTQVDLRQRQDQWNTADSLTGLDTLGDGTVRLTAGSTSLITNTLHRAGEQIRLDDRAGPFYAAEFTLDGSQPSDVEVASITAYLDPVNNTPPNTGVQTVVYWEARLYLLEDAVGAENTFSGGYRPYRFQPVDGGVCRVSAPNTAQEVSFPYTNWGNRPRPKSYGNAGQAAPVLLVVIRGLDVNGIPTTNIGWGWDTVASIGGTGSNSLRGVLITPQDPGYSSRTDQLSVPDITLNLVSGTTATIAFTGANKLTLPQTPTGVVEFVCQGQTPSGSTLTFQAKVNGGDPWVTIVDGSTVGAGTAMDVALAKSATYLVQCILTPDASGLVSPILTQFGVREVALTNFDGLVSNITVNWSLNPLTLKSEIAEAQFDLIRDGNPDYRSAAELFFSQNDIGNMDLRLWLGHPDLPRNLWMLIDIFLVDDQEVVDGGAIRLIAVSPLSMLKQQLPVYNPITGTRAVLSYPNVGLPVATPQAVYDDLLNGQLGLPARYYGQGLPVTTTTLVKTIRNSDAKTEAEALAFLFGYAIIPSQGRLKTVRVHPDDLGTATPAGGRPVAVIPVQELRPGTVTPGFRARVPLYFASYGYDFKNNHYVGESRGINSVALTKLGQAFIDPPTYAPDAVAQWCPGPIILTITSITRAGQVATVTTTGAHNFSTGQQVIVRGASQADYNGTFPIIVTGASTFTYIVQNSPATPATGTLLQCWSGVADALTSRITTAFGTGMLTASFETTYAYPEIELGDLVTVQTGRFSVHDPISGNAISGLVWSLGVVVGQHDAMGHSFTIWVRSPGDLLSGNAAATRLGFALPTLIDISPELDSAGVVNATFRATDASGLKYAVSTSAFPTAATVRAAGVVALDAGGNYTAAALATLAYGQKLYVSALAYENADGTGSESAQLMTVASANYVSDVQPHSALIHKGLCGGGGGNDFSYRIFSTLGYTLVAGDELHYDVWIDPSNPNIQYAADLVFTDTTTLRATGITDQNGLSCHPSTDLSAWAKGRWYHRKIVLTSIAGKITNGWITAHENDTAGMCIGKLANVRIMNGTTVKAVGYSTGAVASLSIHSETGYTGVQVYSSETLSLPIVVNEVVNVGQFDGSGTFRIQADNAASYRYVAVVGTGQVAPAWPSDASVIAGTLRTLASGVDSLSISAGTVPPGQVIRIRAVPLQNADGSGLSGDMVGCEFSRVMDIVRPYPRPEVRIRSTSGSNDATSGKQDITLTIAYSMGPSTNVTLKVWTAKASVTSPDPSATYEGSATIALDGSGLADVAPSTVFTLSGGGTDTLLAAVRVSAGLLVAKRIYAQITTADGIDSGILPVDLPGRFKNIIDSGIISSTDDAFIAATNTLQVGTSGSPSSLLKKLRTDPSSFELDDLASAGGKLLTAGSVSTTTVQSKVLDVKITLWAPIIVLPRGITITKAVAYLQRSNAPNDFAEVKLYKDNVVKATLTQASATTGEVSAVISEVVGDEVWSWRAQLEGTSFGAGGPGVGILHYVRLEYTMPSYDKGV